MLIDLHSHLEGRLRPKSAAELASSFGIATPPGGWDSAIRLAGPADLTVYLSKVAASYPFFSSADATERIAREAVEDAAAAGLDYLELRFGPTTHVTDRNRLTDVISAAAAGVAAGSQSTGMPAGLVIAALRHHDAETNAELARVAARFAGRGVVGFDLAGDELIYPQLEPHQRAFEIARAAGLGLTCHAAEAAPASAVRQAVELLRVSRIGHGAHLAEDPDALAWAADAGVVIEICPTSNFYTGAIMRIADHPAPVFRRAGARLVLGDDNPMQTGSDLVAERAVLIDQLGWTAADLHALDQVSIEAAFLDPAIRDALLRRHSARPPAP